MPTITEQRCEVRVVPLRYCWRQLAVRLGDRTPPTGMSPSASPGRKGYVIMVFLRSLAFNVFLYAFTAACSFIAVAIAVLRPEGLQKFARVWALAWLNAYQRICGVSYEVRGIEHLPYGGCIIAM